MKTEVEKFCAKHRACPEGVAFATRYETLAEVWANCKRGDWMIWMLQRGPKQEREVWVRIAYKAALHVLPIFEKYRVGDNRPRACLKSVSKWLKSPNSVGRPTLNSRAVEAQAAANAAANAAADASADAAYAAANASFFAANAAYAANAADYASHAAADAAERKWQANMLRRVVGNPFDGWKEGVK